MGLLAQRVPANRPVICRTSKSRRNMRTALLMVTLAAAVSFAACSKKEETTTTTTTHARDDGTRRDDDRRDHAARRSGAAAVGRDVGRHGRLVCCGRRFVGQRRRDGCREPLRRSKALAARTQKPPSGGFLHGRSCEPLAQPSRSQSKPSAGSATTTSAGAAAPAAPRARRAPAPAGCSRGSGARRRRGRRPGAGAARRAISAAVALLRWPKRPPMRAFSDGG